ncbi:DUF302 domain-containing protein [Variovorax sp. PCZ-1]|uniref:DUF302 domain-containing protein n=1 Tax=Variovorax sp. PCZ-1 TaxID=2835533 RepID=UPI001BCED7D1|nr:DUF302 domain-containing protein [Variovorax sp. PCZ-1]MBS7807385.1 DUF302 domain-containing protein [Variovorax sp. PCZ-1]
MTFKIYATLCLASISFLSGCASSTSAPASASPEGLITLASPRTAKETMDKLEASVKEKGFAVVARVDHAAAATRAGKTLRPTELLIFGNPAGGTPLMECAQTSGIDLPLKALVWSDTAGKVMLSYNDPSYLAKRHNSPDCAAAGNMGKALEGIMKAVVAP